MEEDDIILTQNFPRWYKSATESTIIFKKLFEIKRYIDQAECIEDSAINHIVEIQGIKFTVSIFVNLHCNFVGIPRFIIGL